MILRLIKKKILQINANLEKKENPEKVKAVADSGIACEQLSLNVEPNEFNKKYLDTKAQRLGHLGNTSQGGK